jgi:signal transduction histidine kinase
MMGWLPCLRHGPDRYFLPRDPAIVETLARALMATPGQTEDRSLITSVMEAMRSHPPLLIHAVIACSLDQTDSLNQFVSADHAANNGLSISLFELAKRWVSQSLKNFSRGDDYLSTPKVTSTNLIRFDELRRYFRTLPIHRWMAEAALWLEVTGGTVDQKWAQTWPVVHDDHPTKSESSSIESSRAAEGSGQDWLHHLARRMISQRSLEESFDQAVHKSKMQSLRQLAYGLSHEINNPLANISTRAQALIRDDSLPPSQTLNDTDRVDSRTATLQRIVDQVYRAHSMIADLMFYANPPAPVFTSIELEPLVEAVFEEFAELARRQAIRMDRRVESGIRLLADPVMIQEAIRGLVRNAIESIGCQGTVVVSSEIADGFVRLHVADSGPGLTDEARKHAFDPYFSGREAGRGLGLGLCRAYRIAQLHQAELTLAGGPAGCVATLKLPSA